MNLLPIWHTSSNNHQKFKILKKRTDLRINGELITKGDLFSHSSQSNHTNRKINFRIMFSDYFKSVCFFKLN